MAEKTNPAREVWLRVAWLLGLLTRNFFWKLLALAIAVAIWIAVTSEPELATIVSVPVEYRNSPQQLEISSDIVSTINVEARGPAGRLASLHDSRTAAVIDFASVTAPGERTFTLTPSELNLPRGVELIRTIPSQLRFRFEKHVTRMLPVQVPLSGRLPDGLTVGKVDVEPGELEVGGPESYVERATKLVSDPFDLSQVNGDTRRTVAVYSSDPEVRMLGATQVTVELQVKASRRRR